MMIGRSNSSVWAGLTVLFATLLLSLGCIPALMTDPVPKTFLATTYALLVYLAQNFLLSIFLGAVLWCIFRFVKSARAQVIVSVTLLASFLLFFILSAKIYAFWHFYMNGPVFDLFFSKGGGTNVFEIGLSMYITIALAIVTFFSVSYGVIIYCRYLSERINPRLFLLVLLGVYIFVQSITLFFARTNKMDYLQYTIRSPYFMSLSWTNILSGIGVPIFPADSLSAALRQELAKQSHLSYPKHPLKFHLPSKPLNVLIIGLDTLRYDMITPNHMPAVYQFSQHADNFSEHFSGGDCTRAGIFTLFYGIPVTYWNSAIKHQQGSILINAFKENHYQMKVLGSAGLLSPAFDKTVFLPLKHLEDSVPGKTPWDRDQAITHQMAHFLDKQQHSSKPFFGFVFYDAPHAYNELALTKPFTPVASMNYFTVNNAENPKPLKHSYENAVLADDGLVHQLLARLKADHLLKNTVVIITSDHGQEFNEYHNNYWEHPSGFSKYQIRTPFIVAWPGRQAANYHYETSHYDLTPTLLKRVLGVSNPASDFSIGHDLYAPEKRHPLIIGQYGQYALVSDRHVMPFTVHGVYRFTNHQMKPLAHDTLSKTEKQLLLNQLSLFYRSKKMAEDAK